MRREKNISSPSPWKLSWEKDGTGVNEESHNKPYPHVHSQMEWAMAVFTPHCSRRASPHFGRYLFPVASRAGGWVGLVVW